MQRIVVGKALQEIKQAWHHVPFLKIFNSIKRDLTDNCNNYNVLSSYYVLISTVLNHFHSLPQKKKKERKKELDKGCDSQRLPCRQCLMLLLRVGDDGSWATHPQQHGWGAPRNQGTGAMPQVCWSQPPPGVHRAVTFIFGVPEGAVTHVGILKIPNYLTVGLWGHVQGCPHTLRCDGPTGQARVATPHSRSQNTCQPALQETGGFVQWCLGGRACSAKSSPAKMEAQSPAPGAPGEPGVKNSISGHRLKLRARPLPVQLKMLVPVWKTW